MPGVDDHEKATKRIHAERDEPVLVLGVLVPNRDSPFVMENRPGIREVDTVLTEIAGTFVRLPFDLHGHAYAHKCIWSNEALGV